ncbi:MAG: hypothetical protein IPN58_17775 [Anaerolineales bacterium]|nr:hypothetical protein [Anaerolineales bacterium]
MGGFRDGLTKEPLSLPVKSVAYLIRYAWSPDSSKIAYLELSYSKPTITPTLRPQGGDGIAIYLVGIIDVATENVSELPLFEANAGIPILLWSPNGRDLLFIKDYSLVLFDVAANKIVKTIKRGCGLERVYPGRQMANGFRIQTMALEASIPPGYASTVR